MVEKKNQIFAIESPPPKEVSCVCVVRWRAWAVSERRRLATEAQLEAATASARVAGAEAAALEARQAIEEASARARQSAALEAAKLEETAASLREVITVKTNHTHPSHPLHDHTHNHRHTGTGISPLLMIVKIMFVALCLPL